MAEEEGKQEEKFDFTAEGEALGYISSDQARLRAGQHARENRQFYGRRYPRREPSILAWVKPGYRQVGNRAFLFSSRS